MTRPELARRLLLFVALAGCDHAATTGPAGVSVEASRRVVVVTPVRQDVTRTITQPANVLALNEATIYAQVAGYLGSIAVDKGDLVRRGDVIATIEVPELEAERKQLVAAKAQTEAELESAKVELERAESTRLAAEAGFRRAEADLALQKALHDRAKDLRNDGVISVQDLEIAEGRWKEAAAALTLADAKEREAAAAKHESETHINVAKAKVDNASAHVDRIDARLRYSKIRAPMNALVTRRYVDPGAMIQQATSSSTQATPIATLVEIDRVRVDFQVPEAEVSHVASGQPVTLHVDSHPGRVFSGAVIRFAGAVEPATRTMLVEAEYANPDLALRSGMYGEARLELERHANALTVPAEAVRTHDGKKVLFVVEDGRVHRRAVTVGLDNGAVVEIAKGLAGTETVVVGGGRLADDTPVVTVERRPEAPREGKE